MNDRLDENGDYKNIVAQLRYVATTEGAMYSHRLMLKQAADDIEELQAKIGRLVAMKVRGVEAIYNSWMDDDDGKDAVIDHLSRRKKEAEDASNFAIEKLNEKNKIIQKLSERIFGRGQELTNISRMSTEEFIQYLDGEKTRGK